MRTRTGRGALGGARRGYGAACGPGCPAKDLMGHVMVRPSTARSYQPSCPGSPPPPQNGFRSGDALQLAPKALQLHPPLFLQAEEAQLPKGPPHHHEKAAEGHATMQNAKKYPVSCYDQQPVVWQLRLFAVTGRALNLGGGGGYILLDCRFKGRGGASKS